MKKKVLEQIQHVAHQDGYDSGYQDGYADGYEIAHADGYENGYENCRKACRMTYDNRRLLFSALDTLRATRGATVDQIVLEVLDYAREAS